MCARLTVWLQLVPSRGCACLDINKRSKHFAERSIPPRVATRKSVRENKNLLRFEQGENVQSHFSVS